jgi:hypothetical protein
MTLIGAAGAGFLVWLSTQIDDKTTGGYWAVYGVIAAAGLAMALSQLLGGWTKFGMPRISPSVFLIAFVPVLVAGGWVVLAHQPHPNWFRNHVLNWSGDIGISGLVHDLTEYVAVLAFGIGLTFGFTFDTTGPRRRVVEGRRAVTPAAVPAEDRTAADEPTTAERRAVATQTTDGEPVTGRDRELVGARRPLFGRRRSTEPAGDAGTAAAPQPEPPPRPGEPE